MPHTQQSVLVGAPGRHAKAREAFARLAEDLDLASCPAHRDRDGRGVPHAVRHEELAALVHLQSAATGSRHAQLVLVSGALRVHCGAQRSGAQRRGAEQSRAEHRIAKHTEWSIGFHSEA